MIDVSKLIERLDVIEERAKQAGGMDRSGGRTPANDAKMLTVVMRRLLAYANRIESHADKAIGCEASKRHADGIRIIVRRSLGEGQ